MKKATIFYTLLTLLFIFISGNLLAQAQTGIYWVDYEQQMLNRTDADGSNYEIMYMGTQYARQAHIDTTNDRIFWNTTDHIRMTSLSGNTNEVITTGTDLLGGIFYDAENDYLWWTEKTQKVISRLNLSTGEKIDVLVEPDGLTAPTGIFFHNGFLYWADEEANTISRSTAEGEDVTVLVADAGTVKDLDIDPENEWMYWANTDEIKRADLNGDNSESILSETVLQLTLDIGEQKIYYVIVTGMGGDLKSYNIEEESTETLSEMYRDYSNPRGLSIKPGDGVYFVNDWDILKYDFETDTSMVAIAPFEPDHIVADFEQELVFFSDRNTKTIFKADAEFSSIEVLYEDTTGSTLHVFGGLDIDTEKEKIFYSVNNVLYGNTYDGANQDSIYESSIWIGRLAADPVNEELYFFDTSFYPSSLLKVNYDGSDEQVLIDKEIADPVSLITDMENGVLYFTHTGKIEQVNTDGSERHIIFDETEGDPVSGVRSLSLDEKNGDLYFGSVDRIFKAALDGSGFSEIYTDTPTQVFGITVNIPQNTDTGIDVTDLPKSLSLHQNYPNPFNPSTVISYQLAVNSAVQLEVFDMLGRKVATLVDGEQKSAGSYSATFDASALSSGIYLYRLQAGNSHLTQKMTLIK
ncbi:MAG: T9SS type A sorting domain-containing protein [Balneolaceae bacterium]